MVALRRTASELQPYVQELRVQAKALAGHVQFGWLDCGEPGGDIICEEQLSVDQPATPTGDHEDADGDDHEDAERDGDSEEDGGAAGSQPEYDSASLPSVLMCVPCCRSAAGLPVS